MTFLILTIFSTLIAVNNAFLCIDKGDGFHPDPYDCAKFYRCHAGQKFEFSCGPGTHFNPSHNGCDWPSAVRCSASEPESEPQPARYNQQNIEQRNQQNNQRHHSHQNHRQPEESVPVETRHQSPQTGYQNPYDNTYEQTNRGYDRRQQRYPDNVDRNGYSGNLDTNYGNEDNVEPNNRQTDNRNKVRPQPKPYQENKRTDNRFTNEDNFGHNFDERVTDNSNSERQTNRRKNKQRYPDDRSPVDGITENSDPNYDELWGVTTTRPKDRVRPQQRPNVEDNQRRGYGRQQEVNREEDDQQWRTTTSRYRRPPARTRSRTSTTVRTTEDPDLSEEEDEFSELFGLKKDSEEQTDSKNWFNFDDFENQNIDTTTEDPFVSMLKSKIPIIQNRTRNDGNRKYGPQQVTTKAPVRTRAKTRAKTTTTLDPFHSDWLAFNSGDNNRRNTNNNNQRPDDNLQSSADLNFKKKPFKDDPLLIPDLISYFNCTEAGKSCDTCQELDWIKYSGIALQALPFRSFNFNKKILSKQCYKACSQSQQCIAFSYSLKSGVCHIYDQLTTDDFNSNKEFNSVVQNSNSHVLRDEWLHTKNGFISGQEIHSVKKENVISCLRECIKNNDNCKAITFDLAENVCKLFDENEGLSINTMKANSVSLQHLSLFENDKNEWRFEDIGYKTLNNSQPINTFNVYENEECFYECLENSNNNCSYVTIEENNESDGNEEESGNKLCHLFAFNSTPKWIESNDKNNKSYILNVPKNHSRIQEYSGYSYVGNPVEVLQNLPEDECREYAEEKCSFCRKYTAIIETKECALFSDSALLSPSISEKNYTEKSGLISFPKDSEYMAFKRIPWKMFATDITPYELKGEINGQKCIQFCLQQKQCLATALVYDTVDSSLFCYFFKEKDLQNANITEYENVDLFIKILDENEIPGHMSNRSDDCSKGEPLDDAVKNVNDLDANMDAVSHKSPDNSYNANNYPLSPHGYDYYGGPVEQNSNTNSQKENIRNVRDTKNQNKDHVESNAEDYDSNTNALSFVNSVKQSSQKKSVLDNIPTISAGLRKAAKKKRLDTQSKKSVAKLSKNCDNQNEFDFEKNNDECDEEKQENQESEKCNEIPSIIYSDAKQMNSCKDGLIGNECEVICRTGYEPNEPKVKCEKSGNRNVWKTKHIKCLPIETDCEEVNSDKSSIRVKASTKYPKEKLHYVLRFKKSKKLPEFSIYIHTKENNNKETEPTNNYNKNSCKLLKGQQLTVSDYKKSDYNPNPLLPKKAFLYSKEAQTLNNNLPNTAPQDPFTSRGPWNTLENRTLEMLKTRPGIVISGVCPQTIGNEIKTRDKKLDIPECFWRIVCVPFDNAVTSAVFYAENTHPISQLEKQSRVDQIRQYRDQKFIIRLLGTDMYRNVWSETYNAYKDANKGIKAFITKCAQTQDNSLEAIAFWDDLINGDNSGQKWQSMFKYGLEKSDEQLKNKSDSQSIDNQNLVSGKRSVDQIPSDDRLASDEVNDLASDGSHNDCENKIIGYITSWGNKSFTVDEGSLLTHAIFAYMHIDSEGNLGPFNNEIEKNKIMFIKLYEMLAVKTKLLAKNHKLKTMVSFGGWNNSEHFSTIVSSAEYRNNFISDALNIIDYWNLEGIEIDWKYPVIGGSKVGQKSDRENFVIFLRQIRQALNAFERVKARSEPLLLSITGASGYWLIEESYDLENIIPLVDWINVLTYDYFGPWKSKWGANTGPNAPLFPSAPIDSLSQMNIHSTIEGYVCRLNSTDKLIMSIPFYGHYWNNVGQPIDTKDNHFRDAHPVGGFVTYNNIKNKWLLNKEFKHFMHNKSLTPYLWSEYRRVLLSYENSKSIEDKIKYAIDHKLGGVSIWALDFDDNQNELLNTIVDNYKSCDSSDDNKDSKNKYKCSSNEKKWFTKDDGPNAGLCGRSAPLIDGFYPVCDPDSDEMSCCSPFGRCGSGPQFCECKGCIDYKKNPELMNKEPVKPKQEIRWLTSDKHSNSEENEDRPICGYKGGLLNGSHPICNPDDDNAHCCSAEGLCGIGSQFCDCKDCINFRNKPNYVYPKKIWWDQSDGLHKAGRCGKLAPKINGKFPICNPSSSEAYCCGKWGYCGSGPISCNCVTCVDFKRSPFFRWD